LLLVGWQVLAGPYRYQGSLIDPPAPAADFTLTDQNGQPFRLSDQRGKVTLVFFGYTHCPDVCPITLASYTKIHERLGEQADQVRFVFITVDPERDTVQQMHDHLANFDPAIIGLTGSSDELEPVWKDYGVFLDAHHGTGVENYDVDHSSRIYAIDAQGNWRLTYPAELNWQAIAEDVIHLMSVN
jgi:protein SCO1/2